MTHSTGAQTSACCWLAGLLERAYPQTAGVTLAAIDAIRSQDMFTAEQLAYVAQLMFNAGAHARTEADRAEIAASCAAHFEPQPTRAERVALRVKAMGEQHEIARLRRTGSPPPEPWTGGTAEDAAAHYGWDADRPDEDFGPSAARWHSGAGVPVRTIWDSRSRTRRYEWKDEA